LTTHPNVPTTFIYAEHDEFFEPDWSRWVARAVLGVEPLEIGTGHFPMVENPDLVARLLA
jgi:pimeloyl-ACP methyl ester carboxylesterase